MIVASRALQATLADSDEADFPIIGFHTIVAIDNITATSSATGFPASNLANPSTTGLQGWRGGNTSTNYLTVTAASDLENDYVAIAAHNFGSTGATVSVERFGTAEDADWEEVFEPFIPADDSPLVLRYEADFCDAIRVKLVPDATAPRAAVLYTGKLTVLPRGVQPGHVPLPYARQRNIITGRSQSGAFHGRVIVGAGRRSTVSINYLEPDYYRNTLDALLDASASTPFFWGWRPETYPTEVGYAWLTSEPVPKHDDLSGYVSVQFDMEGIV